MISVEFVRTMARYNRWQNACVIAAAETLDEDALRVARGAFFGSILGTLNHLLWGDRVWMSRLSDWSVPPGGIKESAELYPTFAAWRADRDRADGRIVVWADALRPAQLRGALTWYSGAVGREVEKPVAVCVAHMFNHQTHHRGQVHAMLTAAGAKTADSDLVFMPETAA